MMFVSHTIRPLAPSAGPERSRVEHPAATAGAARRLVLMVIKAVDAAAVRATEYAERVPAVDRRGVHVMTDADEGIAADWTVTMRGVPLDVLRGPDVVTAVAEAARARVAAPGVDEVVFVLAPQRGGASSGLTLRRLIVGAAPDRAGRAHRPAGPTRPNGASSGFALRIG